MGTTKTENFNRQQNKLASYFKALAHPARIAIIQYIIEKNACICNDLVEDLPLAQSTISQHLKELKQAGIIKGEIEGVKVCYCIDADVWQEAKGMMLNLLDSFNDNQKCC